MANPAQFYGTVTTQLTSTATSDVKTYTPPDTVGHVLLSVETNDARVTFDGSAPASGNGHVIPKSALPLYLPIGRNSPIKVASTTAGNSTLNITGFSS
jgi:hypothetical protein